MEKSEGSVVAIGTPVHAENKLKGREAISVEKAVAAQMELICFLTPETISGLLSRDTQGHLMEALAKRYVSKYVTDTFNGFAEFCNFYSSNEALIARVNQGELTSEDFETMKKFIEDHPQGGPFFESLEETAAFMKQNAIESNNPK